MFSLPTVDIRLEQEVLIARGSATESQGYLLRGLVDLKLQEPTRIKNITLELVGTVGLFTTNRGWMHKILVKQQWPLLEESKEVKVLAADNYPYQFNILLPGSLPETIDLEMGNITYVLNVQVRKPAFTRDVRVSKTLTLRRDSLVNSHSSELFLSHTESPISSLQNSVYLPVKTMLQGESIPLQIMLGHLTEHSVENVVISVLEHVKYRSSIASCRTFKNIATFHFKVQSDDPLEEKKVVLNLSDSSVRFSCDTTYIQVEHEINVRFTAPGFQQDTSVPIWFAPRELQTAYDELPPYSATLDSLRGDIELPTYDLISQFPPQQVLS